MMVKVTSLEIKTGVAETVCKTPRSDTAIAVVVAEAVLLVEVGSVAGDEAMARLVSVPELLGLRIRVAVAVPALGIDPILNATTPVERFVLPGLLLAATRVAPAGKAFVMKT